MKGVVIVLVTALIAGIQCQSLVPTEEQITCFTNFLTNNPSDSRSIAITQACTDLSDETAVCTNVTCFNSIQAVLGQICGYNVSALCAIANVPTPSPVQEQCLNETVQANQDNIFFACGSEHTNLDFFVICGNPQCMNLLRNLYSICRYEDFLNTVCGESPTGTTLPITTFDPFRNLPTPSPEQLACLERTQASRIDEFLNACSSVTLDTIDDFRDFCINRGSCYTIANDIYEDCNFSFDLICAAVLDGFTQTTAVATPEIPTPSPEQIECILTQVMGRESEFDMICANETSENEVEFCQNRGDCFNLLSSLYNRCGYNIEEFCAVLIGPQTTAPVQLTPSPEQLQCIGMQIEERRMEYTSACPVTSNINSLMTVCGNEECVLVVEDIFLSCGSDIVKQVCGGSIKIHAFVMITFIAALLSLSV